jgi:hypothetical protein
MLLPLGHDFFKRILLGRGYRAYVLGREAGSTTMLAEKI